MANIIIIGTVQDQPDTKFVGNPAKAVCQFTIVESSKVGDKVYKSYYPCKCWGDMAEAIGQHISAGDLVCLIGHPKFESWEKDGQKHSRTVYQGQLFRALLSESKDIPF